MEGPGERRAGVRGWGGGDRARESETKTEKGHYHCGCHGGSSSILYLVPDRIQQRACTPGRRVTHACGSIANTVPLRCGAITVALCWLDYPMPCDEGSPHEASSHRKRRGVQMQVAKTCPVSASVRVRAYLEWRLPRGDIGFVDAEAMYAECTASSDEMKNSCASCCANPDWLSFSCHHLERGERGEDGRRRGGVNNTHKGKMDTLLLKKCNLYNHVAR